MMSPTRYQIPSSFLLHCDIDKYHDDNCVRDKKKQWMEILEEKFKINV